MTDYEHDFEIEQARRSLAMLPAGSSALEREEAMVLLERLRDARSRLRRVETDLRGIVGREFPDS